MKACFSSIVTVLLLVGPLLGGGLIPFDEFYVSVETNDWRARREEGVSLNVSVRVSRSAENPEGSISVDVNCFEFEAGQRMLPDADIEAFLAAGDAAREGEAFRDVVTTKTYRGDKETIYEVVEVEGKKMIRMSRGEGRAEFLPAEAVKVREALARARAGEAWFKKLLSDDEMPVPIDGARPPQAKGYYLDSSVGTVSGRGIGYEISVAANSFRSAPRYHVNHQLCLYSPEGRLNGSLSGVWVAGLLQKVSAALDAAVAGKAYSFKSGEDEGRAYTVTANLKTKEADVVLIPGEFFKGRDAERGFFGVAQLAEIRKLIDDCDDRIKWFQANEHLFFAAN